MFLEILIALLIILLLLVLFVSFHIMLELDKEGEKFYYSILIKWLFLSYSVKPEKFMGRGEAPEEKPSPKAEPVEKPAVPEREKEAAKEKVTPEEGKPPVKEKEKKEEKKKEKEPELWTVKNILKLIRLLLVPIIRLLDGILRAIEIHKLKLSLRFGLDDPADTGMVLGYLYALRGYLEYQYERVWLYAEPNFMEMMLDFKVIGDIKFRIANLILPILKFVLNRNVLRASWAIIRKKDIPDPS